MAGYTRNDTSNNIATGNVINAADLDGEFDALVAAFHASTGHTHDGTAANGAPITKIGPVQDLVISTGAITPKTDNTVDLGSSSFEFKDLYIDGTANIDALVADTADINAGTIDGVVIGANSASTGAFTTLSASSTVTLSGGTANGVLYLNGSKVATSGSALVFDGTNLGVGIASVAAAGTTIHVHGSTDSSLRLTNTTTGTGTSNGFKLQANGPDAYLVNYSNGFMAFYTNATEQMRLTSTGLGIGTSSPTAKLVVYGGLDTTYNANVIVASTASTAKIAFEPSGVTSGIQGLNDGGIAFLCNGANTERMRLDSSGNLGLGVTPSAGGLSGYRLFEISAGGASLYAGTNQLLIGSNVSWNGSTASYKTSHQASLYNQASGAHSWSTAPSGTAGNAITFTQAMTLDASGNLVTGGTTLDTGRNITVSGTGATAATAPYFTVNSTAFTGSNGTVFPAGGLLFSAFRDVRNPAYQAGITLDVYNSGGVQALANALIFRINNAQSGDNFANLGNGALPTEVARITSGGYFCSTATGTLFNTTSYNFSWSDVQRFYLYHASATAANAYGIEVRYNSTPNAAGNEFLYCTDTNGGTLRASVRSNGGLANYSANDVNLSDRREKTNFAPAKSYLDTICAIPVQTFNYIDQSEDDPGLTLGVVAQDVQAVAPELVMESNWGTKEDPKMRLSIYQTDLQYALMKCIQEQQAIITALTARVALLEGTQP